MPGRDRLHAGRSPFVGRTDELALLKRSMNESASGRGRIVFIEGEAGIGKTRLVEEVLAGAEQRGFRIQGSVVEELEQRCPFGAIADCLGIGPSARGEGRDEVARLLYGQAP